MYKQDKVEKELFLDTIMIFQCSKDSSLQNITHTQGEKCFSLMDSLKVFENRMRMGWENGMIEEGKENSIYRWNFKGWFTNLLLQIHLRCAYQPYLPNAIKVGLPNFSSSFNQGVLTNLTFQIKSRLVHQPFLPKAYVVVSLVLKENDMSFASYYRFPETTCHFDWCCCLLCSQRKWHVVCILLSFSETTSRFSAANAECYWCLVGPTFNL